MSKFKEKTQPFIMGVLVGLIVAGGFFIFKLDDYFKELNFYKSFIHTFTTESKTHELETNKEEQPKSKENKLPAVLVDLKTDSKKNTISNTETQDIPVANADSLMTSNDTLKFKDDSQVDDVVVRKDEMMVSKTMDVVNLNIAVSHANAKDSLIQKISGVQEEKNSERQYFNIEFWQSPLNYKGYKMSKYKIVLYGIEWMEGIKVFKSGDAVYLKNFTNVYRLDYTGDFKAYEKVNDEILLAKLK